MFQRFRFVLRGNHHIRDITVDDVFGTEHHRPDRRPLGEPLQCLAPVPRRQQRQLGQRGAQQRRGHQRLAQLLEHHGGVGEFAACATEILGYDKRGGADLFAQQLPQRLVVAALGLHRPRTASGEACFSTSAATVSRSRSRSSLRQGLQPAAGATSDRPMPSAAPAPATAAATGRAPG